MNIQRRKMLQLGAATLATGTFASGCMPMAGADKDVLDIVIVGAGVSGLAAGWELMKGGFKSFAVLEARDRVGGRTFNQTVNGQPVESGATWIGPGQTAMYDLCRELDVGVFNSYWKGDYAAVIGDQMMRVPGEPGSPIENPALLAKVEALARTVPLEAPWMAPNAAALDTITFADWLKKNGMPQDELVRAIPLASQTFGANADQISLLYVLHYIHAAGGYTLLETMDGGAQQDRIEGGSQAVSLALRRRLGDVVRLGYPVTTIRNWDGNGPAEIETARGIVKARRVILALSPSQAAEIAFSPALPAGRQAILDGWPRSGSAFNQHFGYKTPFWRKAGLSGFAVFIDSNNNSMLSSDMSPQDGSTGILKFLQNSGVGGTPEQRKTAALAQLVKCFGPEAAEPTDWVWLDWSQEKYTRGCVSPIAPGFLSKLTTPLAEPCGSLHWAGTETAPIWWGYQDGAVRAGRRAAVEALSSLVKA